MVGSHPGAELTSMAAPENMRSFLGSPRIVQILQRALAQDRCEDGLLGAQEERTPRLEQRRGLDVLAGQVDVHEAELLEQPVPVLSRELSDQQ